MPPNQMIYKGLFVVLSILIGLLIMPIADSQQLGHIEKLLDGPDSRNDAERYSTEQMTYEQALCSWKDMNDINDWIRGNFRYDSSRAMSMASNRIEGRLAVYTPQETSLKKEGVCIDLARFTVETAKAIRPDLQVNYLLIEFVPITIENNIFKQHWLVSYRESRELFVFADTKRPGVIVGPYESIDEYIADYQKYRSREIVSYKMLDSFQKQMKQKAKK
jgi:hypothetical protein